MFDESAHVKLSEHLPLGAVKQLAEIQAAGMGRSRHAARE
jgi:hypothetical protein